MFSSRRAALVLEWSLLGSGSVVGRITEEHLSEAEKSFPGIQDMYAGLDQKPKTFLQLVWLYESDRVDCPASISFAASASA